MEWKRNCPSCDTEITYSTKYVKKRAENINAKCKSCAKMGENNNNYGKIFSTEYRKNMSNVRTGMKLSDEHKKNISKSRTGKKWSKEIIQKISRSKRIARIEEIESKFGQIIPNYNSTAIPIILQKARELGISDLQHAENGGEFRVCGYFVDGYSPSKNVVIEYYEPFHKKQVERDKRRKQEIIEELDCKFIEILEYN